MVRIKMELRRSRRIVLKSGSQKQYEDIELDNIHPGSSSPFLARQLTFTKDTGLIEDLIQDQAVVSTAANANRTPKSEIKLKAKNAKKSLSLSIKKNLSVKKQKSPNMEKNAAACQPGLGKPVAKFLSKIPKLNMLNVGASNTQRHATPNFARIHQRAFDKMENLEQHVQKKLDRFHHLSSKKKRKVLKENDPAHATRSNNRRIAKELFIPTVTTTSQMNLNFTKTADSENNKRRGKSPVFRFGNTSIQDNSLKPAFNLEASLSRKLPYKPYFGPLKPYPEMYTAERTNKQVSHKNLHKATGILGNRSEIRRLNLRKTRSNKRFEQQMNNRFL